MQIELPWSRHWWLEFRRPEWPLSEVHFAFFHVLRRHDLAAIIQMLRIRACGARIYWQWYL